MFQAEDECSGRSQLFGFLINSVNPDKAVQTMVPDIVVVQSCAAAWTHGLTQATRNHKIDELTGTCWQCVACHNKLHSHCNPSATCPFCRIAMKEVQRPNILSLFSRRGIPGRLVLSLFNVHIHRHKCILPSPRMEHRTHSQSLSRQAHFLCITSHNVAKQISAVHNQVNPLDARHPNDGPIPIPPSPSPRVTYSPT